jgi:ABC-2 type transport system ATP-binding protein
MDRKSSTTGNRTLNEGAITNIVNIEGLAKSYGKVTAVDGLSLAVKEGSIMGLIGPNGAGKTTTIKVLLGLLKPDRGKIEVFGENPWNNSALRHRIGVVHEQAYFPSNHKALDYLKRVCRIFGFPESRAAETLEKVGLQPEAHDRSIKGLSAGMLQKFAIAHALIHDPEFVVADEPTSNLDPQARNEILDLFLKLNQESKTTFLVSSHILPELSRVCESVAIISKGKVWAQGSFEELCKRFGVGATRVSTDKPETLAKALKELQYVRRIELDARGVSIDVEEGRSQQLYEDILLVASRIGASVSGIESGTASLEELFNLAVEAGRKGGA